MAKYRNRSFGAALDVARALSDAGRVRLLMALSGRELCVCQLIELLGLAPSTVSKHMDVLRRAGFVQSRKRGRWVYYRRTDDTFAADEVRHAAAWIDEAVKDSPEIAGDSERLDMILAIDPEKLCRSREKQ